MAKKNDSGLVQDALIPDEMSPLSLLDFNSSCAKIKQAAVDFRRAVNQKMQLETKDAYLDKFHQIDPYTEAVYDTDVLAQHILGLPGQGDYMRALHLHFCSRDAPDGVIHLLGPAAAKLQEGLIFDNCSNPRSLGRNQGLEIDDIEQGGFHQLTLGQRAFNLDDGFVGKDQISFAGRFDGQFQF